MLEDERQGFSRRHREAAERVRRKNLADRGLDADNVVPLRRHQPRPAFQLSSLTSRPLVLWAGILAILVVVYLVRQVLQ